MNLIQNRLITPPPRLPVTNKKHLFPVFVLCCVLCSLGLAACDSPTGGGDPAPPASTPQVHTLTSDDVVIKITETNTQPKAAIAAKTGNYYWVFLSGVLINKGTITVSGPAISFSGGFTLTLSGNNYTLTGSIPNSRGSPISGPKTFFGSTSGGKTAEELLPQNWKTMTEAQWEAWRSTQGGGLITSWEEMESLCIYFDKTENFNKLSAGGKNFWSPALVVHFGTRKRLVENPGQQKIGDFTYLSKTSNGEGGTTYLLAQVAYAALDTTYDGIYQSLCNFFGGPPYIGAGSGDSPPGWTPTTGRVELQDYPDGYVLTGTVFDSNGVTEVSGRSESWKKRY